MNWNPAPAAQCADSSVLAIYNALAGIGVMICYCVIAFTLWLPAALQSNEQQRRTWIKLLLIFLFCSIAGYGLLSIALFAPRTALVLRTTFLTLLLIVCPLFIHIARQFNFKAFGKEQKAGAELLSVGHEIHDMPDADVVCLARRIITDSLKGSICE